MSERSERNRKIAEWLGFEEIECRIEYHGPQCWRFNGEHILKLPDFYASEEANALLLDAMPEPDLWLESSKGQPKVWGCKPDLDLEYVLAFAPDRKVAIANAFIEWKESLRLIEETGGQR